MNISGLEAAHSVQMTDRIPGLPTDIHFLDLSEIWSILRPFFSKIAKNVKVNQYNKSKSQIHNVNKNLTHMEP